MAAPWMRKRQEAGIITKYREPDIKEDGSSAPDDSALEACASDILAAIAGQDQKGLARALRSAFEVLESEPHEEPGEIEESEEENEG